MKPINVLYIHGMGGGADSRIPGVLAQRLSGTPVRIICRTYPFEPASAAVLLARWQEELQPALIIGESLGAAQALCLKGVPHLLVSPALRAPLYLGLFAPLSRLPGVPALLGRIYPTREGDRQVLDFHYATIRNYMALWKKVKTTASGTSDTGPCFAFFGTRDRYRRTGTVSIRLWRKWFGSDSFRLYAGSHFMEENYIDSLLIPKILEMVFP